MFIKLLALFFAGVAFGENEDATFLYFAYGSNLLEDRIHVNNPSAARVGIGKLQDYRLDFDMYSTSWRGHVATIVPHEGQHVWGAVWEMDVKDLPNLDRQEGVHSNMYFRFEVDVELSDGVLEKCYVYRLVENPKRYVELNNLPPDRRPSPIYLRTIVNGAEESGLPKDYRDFLKTISHNGFNGTVVMNF